MTRSGSPYKGTTEWRQNPPLGEGSLFFAKATLDALDFCLNEQLGRA